MTESQVSTEDQGEFLTAAGVGAILRLHTVTIGFKAAAAQIPGRQIGSRWRFSRTRINEWLKERHTHTCFPSAPFSRRVDPLRYCVDMSIVPVHVL